MKKVMNILKVMVNLVEKAHKKGLLYLIFLILTIYSIYNNSRAKTQINQLNLNLTEVTREFEELKAKNASIGIIYGPVNVTCPHGTKGQTRIGDGFIQISCN